MSKKKLGVKRGAAQPLTFQDRLDREYAIGSRHGFEVGKDIAINQVMDVCLITLHETMGFGADRIWKFFESFNEIYQEFLDLAVEDMKDDPSKAYTKATLDRRLKASVPEDKFVPYKDRYKYDLDGDFIPEKVKRYFND